MVNVLLRIMGFLMGIAIVALGCLACNLFRFALDMVK